jgi:hypothetical protein
MVAFCREKYYNIDMDAAAHKKRPGYLRDPLGRPLTPPKLNAWTDIRPCDVNNVLNKPAKLSRAAIQLIGKGHGKARSHARRKWLLGRGQQTPEYRGCSQLSDIYVAAGGGNIPLEVFGRDLPEILTNIHAPQALQFSFDLLAQLEALQESYRDNVVSTTFVAESEPHAGAPPGADPAPRTHLVTAARPCSAGRRGAGHACLSRHPVARRHTATCGHNLTMR